MRKFNVTFDVTDILEDDCVELVVCAQNEDEAMTVALQEIGGYCKGFIVSEL